MDLIALHNLFDIKYGVNLELVNLELCQKSNPNSINFVSRTENDNGISAFVIKTEDIKPNPGHTISVAGGGSVLSSFYQREPYYSGRDIYVLTPKNKMTELEMLFYAFCLTKNKYRYNYGRQANKTLKDILVPKTMPAEYADIEPPKLNTLNHECVASKEIFLNTDNWEYFELNSLFDITGSKTTSLIDLEEYGIGPYPYITTQAINNGAEGFYNFFSEDEKVLTVDSAVLGYSTYQPRKFSASDHVEKLIPKFKINVYIAMFLTTVLNLEQYRYNYGRKCSQTRMKCIKVKLPVRGIEPDWEFMEKFIKTLPYSMSLND